MCVNIIMYHFSQVSRHLLSTSAAAQSHDKHICARTGHRDIFRNDVIALTYSAYLALHHASSGREVPIQIPGRTWDDTDGLPENVGSDRR